MRHSKRLWATHARCHTPQMSIGRLRLTTLELMLDVSGGLSIHCSGRRKTEMVPLSVPRSSMISLTESLSFLSKVLEWVAYQQISGYLSEWFIYSIPVCLQEVSLHRNGTFQGFLCQYNCYWLWSTCISFRPRPQCCFRYHRPWHSHSKANYILRHSGDSTALASILHYRPYSIRSVHRSVYQSPSCQIQCSLGHCPLSHLHSRCRPYNEDTRTPAPLPCWRYQTVLLSTRRHCGSNSCCAIACIEEAMRWTTFSRLQLNPSKTKFLWCTTTRRLHRIDSKVFSLVGAWWSYHSVNICMQSWHVLRPRYEYVTHVNHLVSSSFYQLRRIRIIRHSLPTSKAITLINSFVISRVDYCNSLLCGLLVRERSALSDPYCQLTWMSVCLWRSLSATLRSNISETKGYRG